MIITHFNRYFQRHGRITYIVLGLIISVIFVIFVTPGDVFGRGPRGRASFGEMYGRKLRRHAVTTGMQETRIALALKYPQVLGQDLGNEILFQQTLMRMRALHEARRLGITRVADKEIVDAIHKSPLFQENGAFSLKAMQGFLNSHVRRGNLNARDFDRIVKENIVIGRLEAQAAANCRPDPREVASYIEKYKVRFAEYPMDLGKDSRNPEPEIRRFFAERKKDIPMPRTKSAVVATFAADDVRRKLAAKDCPADLKKNLLPTDAQVLSQYDKGKAGLYKGKTFDQVKGRIRDMLRDQNIRRHLDGLAARLASRFAAPDAQEPARLNRFHAEAMKLHAHVENTGKFHRHDQPQPGGRPGKALARRILSLDKVGEVSSPVDTLEGVSVAMLATSEETPVPGKLDPYLEDLIDARLTEEKADAFYKETVAPFAAAAPGTRSHGDLAAARLAELRNNLDMTEEDKQNAYREYQLRLQEEVYPFYRPERRGFVLAEFPPEAYRKDVKVTPEALQAAYDARKDEFSRKEVRLARIDLKAKAADAKAVAAARGILAKARARVAAGEDFAAIAKELSESKGKGSGEGGFVEIKSLGKELAAAVEKLGKGQVSPVVATADALHLVKVLDRRDGRTLDQVKDELAREVTNRQSARLAQEDACAFADAANSAWWDNNEKPGKEREDAAKLFKALAGKRPACRVEDIRDAVGYGYFSPRVGQDRALSQAVFALTPRNPVSAAVQGAKASYVALLLDSTPAYLVDPKADPAARTTLDRIYRRKVAMETARRRAEADAARIRQALKKEKDFAKAAAPARFTEVPEFDRMGSQELSRKTSVADPNQTLQLLARCRPGDFIDARKSYSGCVLLFLEGKRIPEDKETLSLKANVESYLRSRNERQAVARLYDRLERESDTRLPEGLLRK